MGGQAVARERLLVPLCLRVRSGTRLRIGPERPGPVSKSVTADSPGGQNVAGALVAFEWINSKGERDSLQPAPGHQVSWPVVDLHPSVRDRPLSINVSTSQLPQRVEIRRFAGGIDEHGQPTEPPKTVECLENGPVQALGQCAFVTRSASTEVRWVASMQVEHVVLSIGWYVPRDYRANSRLTVESASWSFQFRDTPVPPT